MFLYYRMLYKKILEVFRRNKICPFCRRNKKFIILENKTAYLTPAQAPYTKDHLLIIPKRHVLELIRLGKKEKENILDLILHGMKILKKKYPSVLIEYKEGSLKNAGKSIPHLHFHLIPKLKNALDIKITSDRRKFLSDKELIIEVNKLKKS